MEFISIRYPNGEIKEYEKGKPVVIVGSNGSGKTRLSVKLEMLNDSSFQGQYSRDNMLIQRITAQKTLSISDTLVIKGFEESEIEAYMGNPLKSANKSGYRFSGKPATILLNDYDKILSLLFSKNNMELEEHNKEDKRRFESSLDRLDPLNTIIDKVEEIWRELLPDRRLDLSGNSVHAVAGSRYHGKEMSDGERIILYMIVQALSVKESTLFIIDEPELHIHKAILTRLWDILEDSRKDCVFMYITHDLDFAVSRNTDEILWLKSYDGNENWTYDFINISQYSDIPSQLLLELLGNKKKVLFVEGTKSSLDYLLYKEILAEEDVHVIPCGGCSQVISYVRAKNGYDEFGSILVCGVIDRDFRMQEEISVLEHDNIYCLEVAEVENLFVVPKLLKLMQGHFGCEDSAYDESLSFIRGIYTGCKSIQIQEAFLKELDYQLTSLHFNTSTNKAEVLSVINNKFNESYIESIYQEKETLFDSANSIEDMLKLFNFKGLSTKIGSKFGISNSDYPQKVINIIKRSDEEKRKIYVEALREYLPDLNFS